MKHFRNFAPLLLAALILTNGVFAVIGMYQSDAHHQDWCQNWCLQVKPLWIGAAQAIAAFGVSATTVIFLFVVAAAAAVPAKTPAVHFSIGPKISRYFPAGNFFSPLFLALRHRRVEPLLFD